MLRSGSSNSSDFVGRRRRCCCCCFCCCLSELLNALFRCVAGNEEESTDDCGGDDGDGGDILAMMWAPFMVRYDGEVCRLTLSLVPMMLMEMMVVLLLLMAVSLLLLLPQSLMASTNGISGSAKSIVTMMTVTAKTKPARIVPIALAAGPDGCVAGADADG